MVLCEEISQSKDVHRVIAKLLDIHFRYRFVAEKSTNVGKPMC